MSAPSLDSKPWLAGRVPREVDFPKGMLATEERRMLFWITRHHFSNQGSVIDAGAYAGASAFCLASGLARSNYASSPRARVHSYDWFVAYDEYVAEALSRDFSPTLVGDSFRDVFDFQTAKYSDRIIAHEGDFFTQSPPDDQIEILFIDLAKTEELNQRVILDFFPRLVPGVSFVIHQDYNHAWLPHIHVSMGLLDAYFELVDPLVHLCSRVWRLKEEISWQALISAMEIGRPIAEGVRVLDRLIEKESMVAVAEMLKVVKLKLLLTNGTSEEAEAFNRTLPMDCHLDSSVLWQAQLAEVRKMYNLESAK